MDWILDLDGVVWLGEKPIEGSAGAIARLRSTHHRVVFLTNNSSLSIGEYIAKLGGFGIPAEPGDVCSSAQAAALLVEPGETVLVCAGAGVVEALDARGATVVRTIEQAAEKSLAIDAVIVGFHRDFDFARLTAAFKAVRRGARLIGTNDDATYPTPDGPIPGGGSLVAAVAYATGVTPIIAGKPFEPTSRLIRARLGLPPTGPLGGLATMVGDRVSTDGQMANVLGVPFRLVLSGIATPSDIPTDPPPAEVAADLATVVSRYLDGAGR